MTATATYVSATSRRRNEQGGSFRVLVGVLLEDGPEGCECDNCTAEPKQDHVYEAYTAYSQRMKQLKQPPVPYSEYTNDVVTTKKDLDARLNQGPHSRKVERVTAPYKPEEFPLEKMSLRQLLACAEELELDVESIESKEAAIAAIQGARANA